ncbi:hypothetical protein RN001_006778 [Aquatica leii]|uniref:Transcription factor TFIIIC triple barrel domain-containing protein n=1 Tax=Aquatica leii TaxID=1421715 RepID=A0AAN7Q249_9COLE|nr:hypothetical protein RN001_006778 [Aquatica leii]
MSEDFEEKEVYVLLDFENKDMTKLLKQPSTYFRMLNLNENKPIIEVAEDVFEGVYEDAPGTNIFFEEVEDERKSNLFEGETPISLKYFLKQSKMLKLKHIGTKPKLVINPSSIDSVNIDITDDYRTLLDKHKNGTLNIDDYVVENACLVCSDIDVDDDDDCKDDVSEVLSTDDERKEKSKTELASLPDRVTSIPEWYSSVKENTKFSNNPTYSKYLKLQNLAEQPSKHKVETEEVTNGEVEQTLHTSAKKDFIIWKDMMMRVVERQPINLDVNRHNLEDFVDIQKSIQLGIIGNSNKIPRIYTKHEKQKLLSFKNFISLTPLMKLIILQDCLQYEKSEIENMNEEQMEEKGEDGLCANDRVKLLSEFKEELKLLITNRIKDAQKQKGVSSAIEFDVNLSDSCEESSDDYDDTDSDSKSDGMSVEEEEESVAET